MKKMISALLATVVIFSLVTALSSCNEKDDSAVIETTDIVESDTLPDNEGMEASVKIDIEDIHGDYVTIRWCNYTDETISYSLGYSFEANYENPSIQDRYLNKSTANSEQYTLPPMSSRVHTYSLDGIKTDFAGSYTLKVPFGDEYLSANFEVCEQE